MDFKLKIWRQEQGSVKGKMMAYAVKEISPDMSFLEMLDQLNENLTLSGQSPISFDSDCREGICGQCGLFINDHARYERTESVATSTENGSSRPFGRWCGARF